MVARVSGGAAACCQAVARQAAKHRQTRDGSAPTARGQNKTKILEALKGRGLAVAHAAPPVEEEASRSAPTRRPLRTKLRGTTRPATTQALHRQVLKGMDESGDERSPSLSRGSDSALRDPRRSFDLAAAADCDGVWALGLHLSSFGSWGARLGDERR